MKTGKWMAAVMLAAGMFSAGTAGAGDMSPPGPPGPTMHSLAEIYAAVEGLQQQVEALQQRIDGMDQRMQIAGMLRMRGDMVLIPGGTNEGTDPDYGAYSLTVESFYMDRYEVTKELWDVVREWGLSNGYTDLPVGVGKGPDHPVVMVNWYDAVKWCNARSERDGLTPAYGLWMKAPPPDIGLVYVVYRTGEDENVECSFEVDGYRLPTATEWQYAARGGASGRRFPWDDANTVSHARANYNADPDSYAYDVNPVSGYHPDTASPDPHTLPVGSFAANGFGLHDMAGNVLEWCWDPSGLARITQGGGRGNPAQYLRCGSQLPRSPGSRSLVPGFRTVRR